MQWNDSRDINIEGVLYTKGSRIEGAHLDLALQLGIKVIAFVVEAALESANSQAAKDARADISDRSYAELRRLAQDAGHIGGRSRTELEDFMRSLHGD